MSKLKTSADVTSDENSSLVHRRHLLTAPSPGGRGRGSRTRGQNPVMRPHPRDSSSPSKGPRPFSPQQLANVVLLTKNGGRSKRVQG